MYDIDPGEKKRSEIGLPSSDEDYALWKQDFLDKCKNNDGSITDYGDDEHPSYTVSRYTLGDIEYILYEGDRHKIALSLKGEGLSCEFLADGSENTLITLDDGTTHKINTTYYTPEEVASGQAPASQLLDVTGIGPKFSPSDLGYGMRNGALLEFDANGEIIVAKNSKVNAVDMDVAFKVNGPEGPTVATFGVDEDGVVCLFDKESGNKLVFDKEKEKYTNAYPLSLEQNVKALQENLPSVTHIEDDVDGPSRPDAVINERQFQEPSRDR